jgi:hypothetical protein
MRDIGGDHRMPGITQQRVRWRPFRRQAPKSDAAAARPSRALPPQPAAWNIDRVPDRRVDAVPTGMHDRGPWRNLIATGITLSPMQ